MAGPLTEAEAKKAREQAARMEAKRKEIAGQILAAVKALGHEVEKGDVDGIYTSFEVTEDWHHSGYYSKPLGKLRVKFGGYGDVHQYPERKTGFDVKQIAQDLHTWVERRKESRRHEEEVKERKANNDVIAKRLCEKFGLNEYAGPIVTDHGTGELRIKTDMAVDEDEATQILTLLKAMELL